MKYHHLALGLAAALEFWGCNVHKYIAQTNTPPVSVHLQKVQYNGTQRNISISGNVEGSKTVKLGFMVGGKISYIAGEEGTVLKEGQLLASLDSENYSIAKDMAEANLSQTQDEYNRLEQMHERKSVSESDFNKISNALKVAKAQQRLQAKNLSDTKLFSPISGVLIKKGTEAGEIIGAGIPLFAVSKISTVKICASIPESDLNSVKLNMNARVLISSINQSFTGRIVEIGSVADPGSRSFTIKIELNNPKLLIRPGMTAEADIVTDSISKVISIPVETVLHELDNSSYVYVADLTKKQAFKRDIALGRINGNDIEVMSGLQQGDMIIVGGQHKLNNGSLIEEKL